MPSIERHGSSKSQIPTGMFPHWVHMSIPVLSFSAPVKIAFSEHAAGGICGNMWRKMWIPVLFHVYSNIWVNHISKRLKRITWHFSLPKAHPQPYSILAFEPWQTHVVWKHRAQAPWLQTYRCDTFHEINSKWKIPQKIGLNWPPK